ncbi:MAG: ATP-binding protein [Lachnospiraceae bacterium]|nr:ATP-binding protein [Lachnospiraceae bacterium]
MGLTNTQYDTIMRDYQRQQARDHDEHARRQAAVYEKIPEFAQIDAQIASASTACARRMLLDGDAGNQSVLHQLRQTIDQLSARRAALLQEAGFPADYLEPVYRCPDCRDTGYIGNEKCHCFRQAIIDLLYMQSNLRETLKSENFSAFSLDYYQDLVPDALTGLTARQTAEHALKTSLDFVRNFDHAFENLFFYGDTGLGKTFLSHCIAKELIESTHSVIYFSAFRLFELFADSTFGRTDSASQQELEQHIFECDLLIIDDLGTELVNSFVSSQLFLVLNERILRRKSTLISTNLSLGTFADTYSERIFSRISSTYTMLRLIGDDIRIQKKLSAGRA